MGIIGESLDDVFGRVGGFISFVIVYSIIVFVLGEWYGLSMKGTELVWYPIYVLAIALFFKVLMSAGKKRRVRKVAKKE